MRADNFYKWFLKLKNIHTHNNESVTNAFIIVNEFSEKKREMAQRKLKIYQTEEAKRANINR